jgi:hypothetical protein
VTVADDYRPGEEEQDHRLEPEEWHQVQESAGFGWLDSLLEVWIDDDDERAIEEDCGA